MIEQRIKHKRIIYTETGSFLTWFVWLLSLKPPEQIKTKNKKPLSGRHYQFEAAEAEQREGLQRRATVFGKRRPLERDTNRKPPHSQPHPAAVICSESHKHQNMCHLTVQTIIYNPGFQFPPF